MELGILTDDRDLARAGIGEFAHFFADLVDGTQQAPLESDESGAERDAGENSGRATNVVACWGDTATVRDEPARAAVATDGTRATPDAEGHHWGTVCPTDSDYRGALLERLERVGSAGDVRLTTLGFPGESFCRCERCDRAFDASEYVDREAWRTSISTDFVANAADCVAGDLIATLYPDPYPGNLRKRTGLEPAALDAYVDEFVVPLCGAGYGTTYWVESLARGFTRELEGLEATLTIQLSAADVEADRLAGLTQQLESHSSADAVVYGTHPDDADVVRETIRRVRGGDDDVSGAEPPVSTAR